MKDTTRLIHSRGQRLDAKTVNPPIERASTVLLPDREQLYAAKPGYGRMGLAVHRELEQALCLIEGAEAARLTTNGLQACALAIAAVVEAGDHILISDSVYGPTRRFCERRLSTMGIEVTRFEPTASPATLETHIKPTTRAILLESPGSLTFEIMDTPALTAFANAHGLVTIMDNTWGAGLLHQPLDLGVDLSVQALTKYAVGHADAFGGAVMSRDPRLTAKVAACSEDWGISLSPDDAYAALRGLRTLEVRIKAHEAAAYQVADWLSERAEVARVLHPGRADHPQHALWKRDFNGANGLFGAVFHAMDDTALDRFLGALRLFGLGFSWGGYESLVIPCCDQLNRRPDSPWQSREGPLMRFHIGLEAPDDLIADLQQAFTVASCAR